MRGRSLPPSLPPRNTGTKLVPPKPEGARPAGQHSGQRSRTARAGSGMPTLQDSHPDRHRPETLEKTKETVKK